MIIQVLNSQGKTIEYARWNIPQVSSMQEGHGFAILLPFNDNALLSYLTKNQSSDCYVDKENKEISVVLSFNVKRIRHLYEINSKKTDTLCTLIPATRMVEQVLVYLLTPSKIDPKFVQLINR